MVCSQNMVLLYDKTSFHESEVKVKSLSHVRPSATLRTAAFQAPPSMGFSRQEYWSGVPLPSPHFMKGLILIAVFRSFQYSICLFPSKFKYYTVSEISIFTHCRHLFKNTFKNSIFNLSNI